jgi:hypothetical protein
MYVMLRANGLLSNIRHELPTGLAAFIIAELFYKFHSFTLECLAFLATWLVFSWLASMVGSLFKNRNKELSHE